MFILHINDLSNVSKNCNFVLFADNTTVLFHDKNTDNLSLIIDNELKPIVDWFINNKLALNLTKICLVPFCVKKPLELKSVYISNVLIPCVTHTKFWIC